MNSKTQQGPLAGLSVVELPAIGPVPLAGQLLADLGAQVLVIEKPGSGVDGQDISRRNKSLLPLDLKSSLGAATFKRIVAQADVLIEGFRPGVMERLGFAPATFEQINPGLIYARMTGWGQSGPLANTAGHDINYLALTGLLNAVGKRDAPPVPPLNMLADYAGGTMFLLFGVLSALYERNNSGKGQVVDAAMVDGVPAMMSLLYTLLAKQSWSTEREANWLDGGAPYYRCYETKDGRYLSVGALEPAFFKEFVSLAGLPQGDCELREERSNWPSMCARYAQLFQSRSLDEWTAIFAGSDACVAPVLDFYEAASHPHNESRKTFATVEGVLQANAAPRFSRSTVDPVKRAQLTSATSIDADLRSTLQRLGFSVAECDVLMAAVVQN